MNPEAAHEKAGEFVPSAVGAHQASLLRYATRLLGGDAERARDVVQEVFIKAMRETRFFDEDFKMQAWLYRVTRNLCFNLVRDRRRRDGILASVPRSEELHADPIEVVFGSERQDEIIQAIGQLTQDHRTILLLRYYEDMSYAEIAGALSIKLGTVMSRLFHARKAMQFELRSFYEKKNPTSGE